MRTIARENSSKRLVYVGVAAALAISGFASMSALLSAGVIDTRAPLGGSAGVAQQPTDPVTIGSVANPAATLPASSAVANAEPAFPLGPPVVHEAPEPPSQAELAKTRTRSAEDEPRARARTRTVRNRDRNVSAAVHAVR
jgi:hypothetical protein